MFFMMISNRRGSVLLTGLLVVALITVGGLIVVTGFSRKSDKKSAHTLRTGGKARLINEIKNIPNFYDDFLSSNRTNINTSSAFNRCLPMPTEDRAQNFTGCTSSQALNTSGELWDAYRKATGGILSVINGNSAISPVSLVSYSEYPLSGPSTNPRLFDVEGSPCTRNCTFSVQSYMIKEKNPGNPGDVIFAFKVSEIKVGKLDIQGKDEWIFVPVIEKFWNAMPYSEVRDSMVRCPMGMWAFRINNNKSVICRTLEMECADGEMLAGINSDGDPICIPEPIWPESFNPKQVRCDSWDYRYATCLFTNSDPNSTMVDMSVAYKRSNAGCSEGSSFGFRPPSTLWVDNGCRATFNIETKCNGGFALDPTSSICTAVGVGQYSPHLDDRAMNCTNGPANSHYTGPGGATNSCPWECNPGYERVGSSCRFIPTPTPSPSPSATPSPTATTTPSPSPTASP